MSTQDIIAKLERIERALLSPSTYAIQPAKDMAQSIADRVIEEGKRADGALFSPYSRTELPAFFYFNRSTSQGAERKVRKAAKERKSISYFDLRQYNNRPTEHKNFSFTQEMWRDFDVLEVSGGGGLVRVVLGARRQDNKDKIRYNSEREGISIVAPSQAEIAKFATAFAQNVLRNV